MKLRKRLTPSFISRALRLACGLWLLYALSETPVASHVAPAWLAAPSLAQLNAAIARAEPFISNLYKPVDDTTATLAEYYGFPLRVYLTGYSRWLLVGENESTACIAIFCQTTTAISDVVNQATTESFVVDFRSPQSAHAPQIRVEINWDDDSQHYRATLANAQFDDPQTKAEVYLSDIYLSTFSVANVGQRVTLAFDKTNIRPLRTFRYTIRHGNQVGQSYYWYQRELDKVEKLNRFQTQWGFRTDDDVHAPIWGHGTIYPDGMPFHTGGDDEDVYHDCQVTSTRNNLNYPYQSKICKVGAWTYVWTSHSDTLVPTVQAIHVLNKYRDPNRAYSDGVGGTHTALGTALELEPKFDRSGFGIPMCITVACNYSLASGIRTFEFAALETLLGYAHGRTSSQAYADTVAHIALQVQIGDDHLIHTALEGDYYRPTQTGAFYLSWDDSLRYRENRPFGYRQLDELLNMPNEYKGVIVSNTEATHDAYAFLILYRCQKYGVGCALPLEPSLQVDAPSNREETSISLLTRANEVEMQTRVDQMSTGQPAEPAKSAVALAMISPDEKKQSLFTVRWLLIGQPVSAPSVSKGPSRQRALRK